MDRSNRLSLPTLEPWLSFLKDNIQFQSFFKPLYAFPNMVGHRVNLCLRDTASSPERSPRHWFMSFFPLEKNPWLMLNARCEADDVWCCVEHLVIRDWTDNRKGRWKVLKPSSVFTNLHSWNGGGWAAISQEIAFWRISRTFSTSSNDLLCSLPWPL